jgi:hypothetical protein
MAPAEVAYRIGQAARMRLERRGIGLAKTVPATRVPAGKRWCDPLPTSFDALRYTTAADRVLAGTYDVFAHEGCRLGFPPDWNRDPKTGVRAPMTFGKLIDYRSEALVGDIKYLWEPNRHLELVTLAQAWHLSGRQEYADGCRQLLESWLDQCAYPSGPNWTSSLELGIRLVNWSMVWHLTGGWESALFARAGGEAFRDRWLESIRRHCHFVAHHLSLHSSANNHLLGELMGLLVGSLTWPFWAESQTWSDSASRRFEEEALKQNAPDGVNREAAVYYQHEVVDMMLLCALACRASGRKMSAAYWTRLERMIEFLFAVMDSEAHVPMFGDADDAVIVRFVPERPFDVYRSLLATGAVLFDRSDFAAKAGDCDDKTRWLLGDDAARRFEQLRAGLTEGVPIKPAPRSFDAGGYWILGEDSSPGREVRIVADAGALGYLSIAAHGHADALSFTLSAGGQELLVDPGTYAYHTEKVWRDYFRGTSAHNTVRVDGVDQSVPGGNFMWLRHARATCEVFESGAANDRWVARHDGYLRLEDPVLHRRELLLSKADRVLSVHDSLECKESHEVEVCWHFAEDCDVVIHGNEVQVRKAGVVLHLSLTGVALGIECARGREAPPLGWVSRRFDVKQPSPTIRWFGRVPPGASWSTTIRIDFDR